MDLGFMLAQLQFKSLWLLWCAIALPVFLLTHLLFNDSLAVAITLFWWMKPLYEPLLSEWLGHVLFDDQPGVREQLKKSRSVLLRGLIGNLTWRRFSVSRSFNMPVHQLERLKGDSYGKRLLTLQTTNPRSGWLTILCVHLEMALQLSVPILFLMLIPSEVNLGFEEILFAEDEKLIGLLNNGIYFVVASVIAPFYVSAGFALYINARTQLEAWDIEIAFRRMANSTTKGAGSNRGIGVAAALLVILASTFSALPENAHAIDRESAKESITEILAEEDFGKEETLTWWKPKNSDEPETAALDLADSFTLIAEAFRILAWVALAIFLVWLVTKIAANIELLHAPAGKRRRRTGSPLRLLEAENEEEPIPENPVDAVLELCRQQQHREAMSLLYRSTLLNYVLYHDVEIPYSATEGECIRVVSRKRPTPETQYFSNLTGYWQQLAWAEMTPSAEKIRELCDQWPLYFAKQDEEMPDEA